jgi:hypothetical protein
MKVRYAAFLPLILIVMMLGVFAVQAQDPKPLFVEEGSTLPYSPHSPTSSQATSALGYKITTSADDPSCDTIFGGYIDLAEMNIYATAQTTQDPDGDNFAIGPYFTTGGLIDFYGRQYDGLRITDDGFILFGSDYGKPWEPQIIPQKEGPNAIAAPLWQNMKVVYNQRANHGISLGVSQDNAYMVIEFDNVRLVNAPTNQYDMEIVMRRKVSHAPGAHEIVFAYDNLNGSLAGPLTIGLENGAGESGVALVNKERARGVISDGFMVCFDAINGSPPEDTPAAIQASDGIYEDRVRVTWAEVDQAARYDVYRADENGDYEAKIGIAEETLFRDYSAKAGVPYTYRVKACNEYGCSDPSPHDMGWRAGDDDEPVPKPPYENLYYMPLAVTK